MISENNSNFGPLEMPELEIYLPFSHNIYLTSRILIGQKPKWAQKWAHFQSSFFVFSFFCGKPWRRKLNVAFNSPSFETGGFFQFAKKKKKKKR
mmetsp:Transcript_17210/g.22379  ORF Transcript_17210/g.22379 Transcript_17210/m.22379 type:complete len:94 (-) Transcript_17210:24-305(-)